MTTYAVTTTPTTTPDPAHRVLPTLGGVAVLAGVALFLAGAVAAPTSGDGPAAIAESLARQPDLGAASALLLHYGNLLLAGGLLAVPFLVRGARGAVATIVGALLAALAFGNTAGMLLGDFWQIALARTSSPQQVTDLTDAALGQAWLLPWSATAMVLPLALVVLFVGLARAGVLGWWTVPAVLVGSVLPAVVPASIPGSFAIGSLPAFAALAVAGLRLLGRARV
jgi:hypothetical protein